jgi:hypothetical protein
MLFYLVLTAILVFVALHHYRRGYLRGVLDTESRWRDAVGRSCSRSCRRYPGGGEQ